MSLKDVLQQVFDHREYDKFKKIYSNIVAVEYAEEDIRSYR